MRPSLILLMFLVSGPLVAQVSGSFDPHAYVQVELILFTRESDVAGTNRTGVQPERLEKHFPRAFPLGLVSIRDATLSEPWDVSWFENEWAEIEPRLIELSEAEFALGLEERTELIEAPAAQDASEQGISDEKATNDRRVVSDAAETTPMGADEGLSSELEGMDDVPAPEAMPLWQRYRIWYTNLLSNCFAHIAENEWKLGAALRAIERSSGIKVIMHAAWIQPIGRKQQAVLLAGGEAGEVGVLRLRREAFVQAEVSMWRPLAEGYAQLHESRPMRLAHAYYFDHPLIGAILRVDPIRVPPEFG